jgi:hypothetical protein
MVVCTAKSVKTMKPKIKFFAVGRKNQLMSGSPRGGEASSFFFFFFYLLISIKERVVSNMRKAVVCFNTLLFVTTSWAVANLSDEKNSYYGVELRARFLRSSAATIIGASVSNVMLRGGFLRLRSLNERMYSLISR